MRLSVPTGIIAASTRLQGTDLFDGISAFLEQWGVGIFLLVVGVVIAYLVVRQRGVSLEITKIREDSNAKLKKARQEQSTATAAALKELYDQIIQDLRRRDDSLQQALNQATQALSQEVTAREQLEARIEALEEQLRVRERLIQQKDEELRLKTEELAAVREERDQVADQNGVLEQRLRTLENVKLPELTSKIEHLTEKLKDYDGRMNDLAKERDWLKDNNQQLSGEFQALMTEKKNAEAALRQIKREQVKPPEESDG